MPTRFSASGRPAKSSAERGAEPAREPGLVANLPPEPATKPPPEPPAKPPPEPAVDYLIAAIRNGHTANLNSGEDYTKDDPPVAPTWDDQFKELQKFEGVDFDIPPGNTTLLNWVDTQKRKLKEGFLDLEKMVACKTYTKPSPLVSLLNH